MEYEDKIALCEELLAEDYKISERTAHRLIYDLDLADIVLERYEEEIQEKENELHEEWEEEMKYFPYSGDIHGGI